MNEVSEPWTTTDAEWEELGHILSADSRPARPGRPRLEDVRSIAEACLFRSFHSLAGGRNHCFDWNGLPRSFGVSPSTANRRFREWNESGAWAEFWTGLLRLRRPERRVRPRRARRTSPYPVADILGELQRAYHFFNGLLFGGLLPEEIAITVIRGEGPGGARGYFCGRSWLWGREEPVDLIAVSGLAIQAGPHAALETLIHEMVHLRNARVGLVDCTNRGLYHNRHYRDAAVLAGLACGACDKNHGYGATTLGVAGAKAVARLRPKASLFKAATTAVEDSPESS